MQLAKQIHCEHVVQQSLLLVSDLFGLSNEAMHQLIQKPDRRVRKLTAMAKEFVSGAYVATNGIANPRMFFKYRYYIFMLAVKRKRIRVLICDLFKIDEVFPYVTFPDRLSFMYYLVYPAWVIKYVWTSVFKSDYKRRGASTKV